MKITINKFGIIDRFTERHVSRQTSGNAGKAKTQTKQTHLLTHSF